MKITVLRKTEYKGCPVCIMHFSNVFQYFFFYKGELYENRFYLQTTRVKRILNFLRILPDDKLFTKDEQDEAVGVILNGAFTTIDKLQETPKQQPQEFIKSPFFAKT